MIPSINSESIMNWKLVLALLAAWVVVFMCMVKGIKSSGKVSIHTTWISHLLSDGHYSEKILERKTVDVNEHDILSNITLRHK
jgi:hypothetical protein